MSVLFSKATSCKTSFSPPAFDYYKTEAVYYAFAETFWIDLNPTQQVFENENFHRHVRIDINQIGGSSDPYKGVPIFLNSTIEFVAFPLSMVRSTQGPGYIFMDEESFEQGCSFCLKFRSARSGFILVINVVNISDTRAGTLDYTQSLVFRGERFEDLDFIGE